MLYEVITISAEKQLLQLDFYVYASRKIELHRITSYNVCYTKLLRTGVTALGAAQHLDTHYRTRTGVIGDIQCRLHLNHLI